ncbi:MAG: type IV pilus twitching motility protein PilT [Bacteroidetes bacterium]|nr:type IV pilus twitching motility protein PilT [Bacteroidota bacterium]
MSTSALDTLLIDAFRKGASDIHLSAHHFPLMRHHGELLPMSTSSLGHDGLHSMLMEILSEDQQRAFAANKELDFAYEIADVSRFRVNLYLQMRGVAAAFRTIPKRILSLEELGMPEGVYDLARLKKGLVLVTGPTGSGKSTTLAGMIDLINQERHDHILTIEDPIEYTYTPKNCLVSQRELGPHTHSFANALKSALREDPDVILVGEMRDLETIALAITAAETGHLVFATLHTKSAAETVDRIVDVFPSDQQQQIRVMLANTIQGVIAQRLLRKADGSGRVAVNEILVATAAVRNLIRENKTHQVYSAIQTGGQFHMQTMDQSLTTFYRKALISVEDARREAYDKELFK